MVRMDVTRALLIALSMMGAAGVARPAFAQPAPVCNLQAVAANKAELTRLTALRRFDSHAVSNDAFVAASQLYVQSAEACFAVLYGPATQTIDDGGLFVDVDHLSSFILYGNKWGTGAPYTGTGGDNVGPHLPGGTVTYSFMPSGLNLSAEPGGVVGSSLALSSLPTYQPCFRTEIVNALAAWSAVANIQFVEVADSGLPFNAFAATGDIRIGAHAFDGPSGTLAHAYYPPPGGSATGDVHFDQAENWSCTPGPGLMDIGLVALHEVGHALGLAHETRSERPAVMNPAYNPSVANVLLGDDVDGIVNIYGSSTGATDDLLVNFGADFGLWRYSYRGGWGQLDTQSPEAVLVADLDGNGIKDLVINFGGDTGVWVYMNTASWFQLHPESPTHMVAGDLDGNGLDDLILSFPGAGLYVWYNSTTWVSIHPSEPSLMAVGNIDGRLGADLVVDFPGNGVWTYRNDSVWSQLHGADASLIAIARMDQAAAAPAATGPPGCDDILIAFPGNGLFQYTNDSGWSLVNSFVPLRLAVGDLDLDGRDDLTIDFGPSVGLWTLTNGATWTKLHYLSSESITMGDLDGNGQDEIIVDFGPGYGIWVRVNNSSWLQLHGASAVEIKVADFN
jgi:Matrixin